MGLVTKVAQQSSQDLVERGLTMNDLFISYAHIDDLPISEDQKGWITEFQRILENRLAQLMGEKPKIWRDQKLSGKRHFRRANRRTI